MLRRDFFFKLRKTIAIVLLAAGTVNAQQKRLYLANDDHTDYMWTGNEAQYDSVMVKMLDYYLDQIDATAQKNPADFQARFNCDGSYWLRVYEKFRTPAQFNRLVAALRSGHISSPLNTLVSTYGAQPTEAVIRGMYYAGQMERRLGLRFPLAVCMENQTLPLGLSSLWAGSGAKYSWRGVCACASRIPAAGFAHRRHQLYRYMGMDGRGVTMKWYDLKTSNKSLGGYAEIRQQDKTNDPLIGLTKTIEVLTSLCDTISEKSTYPFNVAGAFGYGWDDLDTYVSPAFITAAQKGTTPERRVRVSNEVDFFEDVARTYPKLPSESVSYGNEWDTYCVSMNETAAKVRRAAEKLRAAEALASIVSLKNKTFGNNLTALRQKAWDGYGLFWEHDWTADGPVKPKERAEWQIRMQQQISGYTDSLFNQSLYTLGNQLQKAVNSRFYVFNPLSWVRNDAADVEYTGSLPVKVVDVSTGKETASQVVMKNGKQYLRIHAEKLPSVGYKVFEIQQGAPMVLPQAAAVSGEYFQNAFYRIRLLKSGVISELYDSLANGKQLVKAMDGKYLNDLGITNLDEGEPLTVENAGPVSVTLKAVSNYPILHTVRVTLFKDSPRIEIQDSIQANFSDLKTWAFSFNLNRPTTRHEELGAILTAKNERNGGHYATQSRTGGPARYDWLTFNHFADLSEANYGVTLSNQDCSFFKLGNSTPDSLWEHSSQLNALAGGQTDGPKLGIPAQNGNSHFIYQFALTTHNAPFDPTAAMKFALEHQNPLVTGGITGKNGDSRKSFSLLSVSDPNVLLWSVKPSEDGFKNGLITRLWNMNAKSTQTSIQLSQPLKAAWQTTHIETNEQSLKPVSNTLKVHFDQYQLKTYRLIVK